MANALYGLGRQAFLDGDIDFSLDVIQAMLVDTGLYTLSIDVDNALDDIPAAARVGTRQTLSAKTSTLGVADAADVTFPTISGATVEAIVVLQSGTTEALSRLIAFIDVATGLPVTPSGGDIIVQWDNGANKIFKL